VNDIWLARHGETEWSANGRHTGTTDIPLTPNGVKQAAALCRLLDRHRFAVVLCSPLGRARETARIAGFEGRYELVPDLHEWEYGEYEGLTTAQIREREPGWTIWHGATPGGETAEHVEARARRVLDRCREAGGDVLLFSHGHFLRALTAVYLGFGARDGAAFALDTATVGVLGHEHDYPTLRRWNVTA
jgi:probable phosphoglycerate mutase